MASPSVDRRLAGFGIRVMAHSAINTRRPPRRFPRSARSWARTILEGTVAGRRNQPRGRDGWRSSRR